MHQSSQGIYKKNILFKSLNAEVLKSTLGILTIFFFLVIGSRFVGYFEQAAEGAINPNLVYKIVALRFPDFITLLIPLSFFWVWWLVLVDFMLIEKFMDISQLDYLEMI